MRLNYLANAVGLIMIYIGVVVFLPIAVALFYGDTSSILPFLIAGLFSVACGFCLKKFVKNASNIENINDIKKSEALFTVVSAWVVFGLVATIPYLFYGFSPINALFEAVSGITTTGATILTNFDYPKALFFWRSFSQWLGGMGIIVLFIAVLPQFAVAGRQMFFAEAPGPTEDKITPRIRHTATALWGIYIGLTVLQIILLIVFGMMPFDAVCNAFSTLSAGGFSPNPESTMGYNSMAINWIFIVFMFLAGASFALQFRVIRNLNPLLFFKSEEFKLYLGIVLVTSIGIAISLVIYENHNVFEAVTNALYQVSSIITSTGSASVDYVQWGDTAKILLFVVMFTGACAGSAGGGIKLVRILLVFKYLKCELTKVLHPNAVLNVKLDNVIIPKDVMSQILAFVIFYFVIIAISAVLVSIIENDMVIGLAGSISTLGDIGPAFGQSIGPMGNYDALHPLTKIIFIINMLIGRLELIPFLVLFQQDFWTIKND